MQRPCTRETVLEAKLLLSMVSRMPAGDVRIELTDEGQAIISGGVAEFEIPAMNASDYPSLPVTGADNTMTIPTSMMRDLIEKTIYAVSQDDKKPAHTGELFVIEPGSLTIVALDGYRLAIIQRDVECTRDIRIIIPAQNAAGTLKDHGRAGRPRQDRRQPPVRGVHHQRLHHHEPPDRGRLPQLRECHPQRQEDPGDGGLQDLHQHHRACVADHHRAAEEPAAHHLCRGQDHRAVPDAAGQSGGRVPARGHDRDPVEIGFNNRYLLDAMRYSKCERMVLEINGPLSPVKILPEDGKDFIYLVLPVRFKNEG